MKENNIDLNKNLFPEISYTNKQVLLNNIFTYSRFIYYIIVTFMIIIFICTKCLSELSKIYTIKNYILTHPFLPIVMILLSLALFVIDIYKYHNLRVKRNNDSIILNYGLSKTKSISVPIDKISSVHINQTFIMRLFHYYSASFTLISYDNELEKNIKFILPCKKDVLFKYLSIIIPEYNFISEYNFIPDTKPKFSKTVLLHVILGITCYYAILLPLLFMQLHFVSDFKLSKAFIIFCITAIFLRYVFEIMQIFPSNTIMFDNYILLTVGTFKKEFVVIPYANIQSVSFSRNPISYLTKYGTLCITNITKSDILLISPLIHEYDFEILNEKLKNIQNQPNL